MNAATNGDQTPPASAENAPPPTQTNNQPPLAEDKYNPMAQIIERHENAVNRLKRGK